VYCARWLMHNSCTRRGAVVAACADQQHCNCRLVQSAYCRCPSLAAVQVS
jgi:hypothetical protein